MPFLNLEAGLQGTTDGYGSLICRFNFGQGTTWVYGFPYISIFTLDGEMRGPLGPLYVDSIFGWGTMGNYRVAYMQFSLFWTGDYRGLRGP